MNGCAGDDGIVVADDDSDFDAYENARYMVNQCQNISWTETGSGRLKLKWPEN